MHFTPLALLALTPLTLALALPTTLNLTLSLHPRAPSDSTTIAIYPDAACKGHAAYLHREPVLGDCMAFTPVATPGKDSYLGIRWGSLGGADDFGYTAFTSSDCSGEFFEMVLKPGVGPDGTPQKGQSNVDQTCVKIEGPGAWSSLKFRHRGDGKTEGPWMTDGH